MEEVQKKFTETEAGMESQISGLKDSISGLERQIREKKAVCDAARAEMANTSGGDGGKEEEKDGGHDQLAIEDEDGHGEFSGLRNHHPSALTAKRNVQFPSPFTQSNLTTKQIPRRRTKKCGT